MTTGFGCKPERNRLLANENISFLMFVHGEVPVSHSCVIHLAEYNPSTIERGTVVAICIVFNMKQQFTIYGAVKVVALFNELYFIPFILHQPGPASYK